LITVIDLGISNITSVSRALHRLGIDHIVSTGPKDIRRAQQLILPGVGNFAEAARRLRESGLDIILREAVLKEKKPILGICLGMQLFASYGEEGGGAPGLDLIRGKVLYHRASQSNLRLPHIGWNDVHFNGLSIAGTLIDVCTTNISNSKKTNVEILTATVNTISEKVSNGNSCFYFVHSYEFMPEEPVKTATSHYGVDFVAAIQKDNILGVQFHPEKSQEAGLKLLENFCHIGISMH